VRSAFEPSRTNSIPCSGSRPRSTRSASSAVATVAFSDEPSQSPRGTFTPWVVIPSATIIIRLELQPVEHHHPQPQIPQLPMSSPSASRVRPTNTLDTALLDVDRALVSTSSPTGSCVRG